MLFYSCLLFYSCFPVLFLLCCSILALPFYSFFAVLFFALLFYSCYAVLFLFAVLFLLCCSILAMLSYSCFAVLFLPCCSILALLFYPKIRIRNKKKSEFTTREANSRNQMTTCENFLVNCVFIFAYDNNCLYWIEKKLFLFILLLL